MKQLMHIISIKLLYRYDTTNAFTFHKAMCCFFSVSKDDILKLKNTTVGILNSVYLIVSKNFVLETLKDIYSTTFIEWPTLSIFKTC